MTQDVVAMFGGASLSTLRLQALNLAPCSRRRLFALLNGQAMAVSPDPLPIGAEKLLNSKHFHGRGVGRPHEYKPNSEIGKVRVLSQKKVVFYE
jgi:hypothetical protein